MAQPLDRLPAAVAEVVVDRVGGDPADHRPLFVACREATPVQPCHGGPARARPCPDTTDLGDGRDTAHRARSGPGRRAGGTQRGKQHVTLEGRLVVASAQVQEGVRVGETDRALDDRHVSVTEVLAEVGGRLGGHDVAGVDPEGKRSCFGDCGAPEGRSPVGRRVDAARDRRRG